MPSSQDFNFLVLKSGKITFTPPSSYAALKGYANCQTGQNTTASTNWRAFFNFDTSELPLNAVITKVEFVVRLSGSQPLGDPEFYALRFSIGTFIGGALNGDATEFAAGTLMASLDDKPLDGDVIDLASDGANPIPHVNRTGDTDIKVWDDSSKGSGDASWGINFNTVSSRCLLRITYTIPSGTATGVGSATCSASVTAAASATATGVGGASCAASVAHVASGTATGRGSASCAASVISAASGTATGRGSATCFAHQILNASGSATGVGSASCVATAEHPPLARHSAVRSLTPMNSATRAVSAVHEATRTVELTDTETRDLGGGN